MKRLLFVLFLLILVILQPNYVFAESSIDVTRAHGNSISDFYQPKGSIIADSQTGRILWEEHIDKTWRPASMSKLMTLSIVLERIQDGSLSMDKAVTVTADDERFSHHPLLSNNIMHEGAQYTIKELINLLIVPSSNVATRMLMQQVEPDTSKFVTMMNQKARMLKMEHTHFTNPFGAENRSVGNEYLPPGSNLDEDNSSTPRDFAKLAFYLKNTYPYLTSFTKHITYISKPNTPYEEHFHTYHHSLEGDVHEYKGTNGLKTGSSDKAAYNYTATIDRGNFGLVQVVMGVGHWDVDDSEYKRHVIGNALLDKVYNQFEYKEVMPKGKQFINGKWYNVETPLRDVVEKGQQIKFEVKNNQLLVADTKRQYLTSDMKQPSVTVTPLKQNYIYRVSRYGWHLLIAMCLIVILCIISRNRKNSDEMK
ncbi:DUF1958 domain-containing protein [Staphylococcus pseudoxylosus]|uniref:DUF1958 domain-containing protein n=1 Tax=Staphylococcus pseudoxylosus TaxID=2282419 RepID=UPI00298F8EE2|nr:DUF1958 domain-containing protein [Staphylococcus pseudoxylosus]